MNRLEIKVSNKNNIQLKNSLKKLFVQRQQWQKLPLNETYHAEIFAEKLKSFAGFWSVKTQSFPQQLQLEI